MPANTKKSVVIANNDIVYLWWSLPKKIKNCLGFSIHRIINGKEQKKALFATVGFDRDNDPRKSPQTTDEWPVQAFNWKDLYAPLNKEIKYKIYPMVGTWDNLTKDTSNAITTKTTKRSPVYGDAKVIFNRGLLSTQAFAKSGVEGKKITSTEARKFITEPTNVWRKRLGGQMLDHVDKFFQRASDDGGTYFAALYELTDEKLIKDLTRNKGTQIILSNGGVDDETNAKTRKALHKLADITTHDRMLGSHIGHNKFVIYVDKNGKPRSVLTGSTNWTPTGLCGQTNNMLILESDAIAKKYLEYWDQMKDDIPNKQGADFRTWCCDNSLTKKLKANQGEITIWYSPNTQQKTKPANPPTPVDMQQVFDLIANAKESVLYLLFNPGSPSIIDAIKTAAANRPANDPLFVRGAVSDIRIAEKVSTNIVSTDILAKPKTYHVERVTGVAAIPGPFSYFEAELLKLGFATIHDKVLVIDPFSKDSVVITGSHNLGFTASYKNDENLVIIKGNRPIAEAYAAHILDVVNHFKWRYKLQDKIKRSGAKTTKAKEAVLKKQWGDLDETDKWMDYYFDDNGFIKRDKFILK